jgi:hypothetical protein
MNFPNTHPLWMWLYFGIFGSTGLVLFILIVWNWLKYHAQANGAQRKASRWLIFGYFFLFCAAWFACGIGGGPGNMLGTERAFNQMAATGAATLAMFFSVPGWICVLIGQRKLLRNLPPEKSGSDSDSEIQ